MLVNRKRAEEIMKKYGVEAIIASSPENVTYLSDFWDDGHWVIKGTQVYAVLPLDRSIDPFIVTSVGALDQAAIEKNCWMSNFYTYGKFFIQVPDEEDFSETEQKLKKLLNTMNKEDDPVSALINGLAERDLIGKRIAIDEMNITPKLFESIRKKVSNTEILYGYSMMREIRSVKTEEEVKRLQRSAEIIEKGFLNAIQNIHEGMSEIEITDILRQTVIEQGGLPVFACIGAGHNSAFPNVIPTDYKVQRGDLIRFDIGCLYEHYHSDTARIAVLGKPTDKQRVYYNAVKIGEEQALRLVKPGTKASEIFREAVESVRKAGIPHYERNHVGHGVGIECYDLPNITPLSGDILEEGMVLNIETPYYELGFGGVQVEDTLLVTKSGYQQLTRNGRDLFIL